MGIRNYKSYAARLIEIVYKANRSLISSTGVPRQTMIRIEKELKQSGMPEELVIQVMEKESSSVRARAVLWIMDNIQD